MFEKINKISYNECVNKSFGGEKMMQFVFENTILDRLPMSLSGITNISGVFAGGVCPKLNRFQKAK